MSKLIVELLVICCLLSSLFVVVSCAVVRHALPSSISTSFSCLPYEQITEVQVDCCFVIIVCCQLPLWFVIVELWFIVFVVVSLAVPLCVIRAVKHFNVILAPAVGSKD